MKKSQIWVSAVLYMALGVIILSLVLAAGLPLINKLRDKNTVIQTKNLMFTLDNKIRTVVSEGPGSQRPLKLDIGKGKFEIIEEDETIKWSLETKFLLSELNIPIYEGNLKILTGETRIEDQYNVELSLNYSGFSDIELTNPTNVFSGKYNLLVINKGLDPGPLPKVTITEL